ncbi:MAG: purine-binding chemotaxis protein CheW [Lachnospiraceae bacterium]|nr:purine-binding chemotaxis protein CheW [Lachnospiraceae bacterium]
MAELATLDSKQYIVVELGSEQYGIDIQYIDNIVRMQRITRVPKAQPYFKGVINLRGEVIPVMSLRLKFEFDEDVITGNTRILILKPDAHSSVGIIVDSVKEVLTLPNDMIDKGAKDANDERAVYLSGVGKNGDNLISILNIVGMFTEKEDENA